MHRIASELSNWYHNNKRDLPWRKVQDPYIIWLSEIILQQTRVDQGLPYFEKFVKHFPTIRHFARAHEDEILKLWQGLGYYSRARNMHFTAKFIVKEFNGSFPEDFAELKKLKGIGDYTAAAIASFVFNKPHPVVDGNVYRFLSRYFGIKTPIDSTIGKKKFLTIAQQLLDKKNPGIHNQAIMEFGALQCRPANPDCSTCPLQIDCYAFCHNKVKVLPVKSKKQKVTERYFNYLFIQWKDKVFLNKRTGNGIWKNLYEFPLIETEKKIPYFKLLQTNEWRAIFGDLKIHFSAVSPPYKHQLSHQTIQACFYEFKLKSKPNEELRKKFLEVNIADLDKYGVPRLIDKFLKLKPPDFYVNMPDQTTPKK